jgi:hypothetical protein
MEDMQGFVRRSAAWRLPGQTGEPIEEKRRFVCREPSNSDFSPVREIIAGAGNDLRPLIHSALIFGIAPER